MLLRDAAPADAAAIAAIYNASIRAGGSTMDQTEKTADDIARMMAAFHDREALVVLDGPDGLVGWGIIKRYSDRPGYQFCCETSVYLRHDQFRQGHGSRIQAALVARCRALGYHHLVAKIWAENTASIALHTKYGYEMVGIQREIGFYAGRWVDVAIMQCVLPMPPPSTPR